jgi:predicted alpha/beta superfamily hydrolase
VFSPDGAARDGVVRFSATNARRNGDAVPRLLFGLVLAALSIAPAPAADEVFRSGFEALPPATLIVHYPAGNHTLAARGAGGGLSLNQGTAFTRNGDTFTLVLGDIASAFDWKPLLDDVTYALGPNYRVGPGQTVEVYPRFTTATGQVITLIPAFQSALLGNSRAIYAYLPPSYQENTLARFPVVYMHDGQNLWAAHPEWAFGNTPWQVDTAFDTGAADGTIKEAIVIGIANTANRIAEYTPTVDATYGGGGADLYLRMIVEELKPTVDAALRTRTDAASTVMAGSSLGGLVTAHAGRTKPTVFGRIAALSPSTWWDNGVIITEVQGTPPAPNRPLRVYLDSGDSGPGNDTVTLTTSLANAYLGVGYVAGSNFKHLIQPGASHNESFWAQRFPGAMQFVLGPRD